MSVNTSDAPPAATAMPVTARAVAPMSRSRGLVSARMTLRSLTDMAPLSHGRRDRGGGEQERCQVVAGVPSVVASAGSSELSCIHGGLETHNGRILQRVVHGAMCDGAPHCVD